MDLTSTLARSYDPLVSLRSGDWRARAHTDRCPTCDGYGQDAHSTPCSDCDGTGRYL